MSDLNYGIESFIFKFFISCNQGWKGKNCDECITLEGCHVDHGKCVNEPFTCSCADGWLGHYCNCPRCAPGIKT